MSIESRYNEVCHTESDIRDLIPVLRSLAELVDRVTEFGTRTGNSLTAFVAAQPRRVDCYDLTILPEARAIAAESGLTDVYFHECDTTRCPIIRRTGLLFVDTNHRGDHVFRELNRHANKVRHFIAFHDTHTFGKRGCGSRRGKYVEGLLSGISRWQKTHVDWREIYRTDKSNGLLVLQRECSEITWEVPPC